MKQNKWFLAAITLAVSIGLAAASGWAQAPEKTPKAPSPGIEREPGKTPPAVGQQPKVDLSSSDITKIQDALRKEGFQPGEEGKLDAKTQQALRDFQKKNNLKVTGQPDRETAQKLGVKIGEADGPARSPGAKQERAPMPGAGPTSPGKSGTK